MAVEDKYIDSDLAAGYKQDPNKAGGSRALITMQSFDVAAADDDGSVYRIGRIASNAMLFECIIGCTAITNGTDYDLGLYEVGVGGAVVDKDLFMDGQTLAVAAKNIDGLANISVANADKRIYELLGLSADPMKQYDLAITANAAGTVDGSISIKLLTAQY